MLTELTSCRAGALVGARAPRARLQQLAADGVCLHLCVQTTEQKMIAGGRTEESAACALVWQDACCNALLRQLTPAGGNQSVGVLGFGQMHCGSHATGDV